MTDTHPYATRSRIRNAYNTKVIQGPATIRKNKTQKNLLSNGDSEKAGIINEKKEEVEDDRLGQGENLREEVAGEMLMELERRIPHVEVKRLEESRIKEEMKELEKEKKSQLKAEEERIQLQFELEQERRERLLLEELRLEQIRAEEENREKLRIEQEKLENLRKENQLMKERLEKQRWEVEQKYQQKPPTPMVLGEDAGTSTNCCPTQETTLNNGLMNIKHEIPSPESKSASATEKALKQLEEKREKSYQKWKKTIKTPLSIRRKWRNNRLSKLLVPKSGVTFLNELKPGCTYSIHEQKEGNNVTFVATVENEGKVIAVGHGSSKMFAKRVAAENAIKIFITSMFKKNSNQQLKNEAEGSSELDLPPISWIGLASYAMHKMFSDWEKQGNEFSFENFVVKKKPKNREPVPVKKDLPPDANKLHPAHVLNLMIPGLGPVELQRTLNNNVTSVTVGYKVNGKMYTGTATSKKKARATAAKAVLTALYGIKYED